MSLIKSISGIRGTIGGAAGDNLTPLDTVRFVSAFALFLKKNNPGVRVRAVVGRDGRVSGAMLRDLVVGTLISQGIDVVDLEMATTPTVEMGVIMLKAQGGIILTASHNPAGWNALKLLNAAGEFLTAVDGQQILETAERNDLSFETEDKLGSYSINQEIAEEHLTEILKLPLVKKDNIAARDFKVVVDGINSIGGVMVPKLLRLLGVNKIIELNCEPNGRFAHKPEPLDENLTEIKARVKAEKADLGIIVDPDVDRLAFIDENGVMFGEEYTLVAVSDYVLRNFEALKAANPGKYEKATVSNLSSSRALKDITENYGGKYEAAAVGEVNVVASMRALKAVIGGEGNGGVIFPELHYGRDALLGIALFLSALIEKKQVISEYKKSFPEYFMVKDRLDLTPNINLSELLNNIKEAYKHEKITDIDGVKIDWPDSWVHLRASNTEPIVRIYAEAKSLDSAAQKVAEIKEKILAYIK
ncbi:MAG: phosphoglucosamine mutase [Patescibacteria group bacterium]|jgi:phosphomannomutase